MTTSLYLFTISEWNDLSISVMLAALSAL